MKISALLPSHYFYLSREFHFFFFLRKGAVFTFTLSLFQNFSLGRVYGIVGNFVQKKKKSNTRYEWKTERRTFKVEEVSEKFTPFFLGDPIEGS